MEKNNKKKLLLVFSILFLTLFSCSTYKESFKNKFFLYLYNYMDADCKLILTSPNEKKGIIEINIKKQTYKISEYKNFLKNSKDIVTVKLLIEDKELFSQEISFPNNGIYSYSVYGGLSTRINIYYDENNNPMLNFSDDWDVENNLL